VDAHLAQRTLRRWALLAGLVLLSTPAAAQLQQIERLLDERRPDSALTLLDDVLLQARRQGDSVRIAAALAMAARAHTVAGRHRRALGLLEQVIEIRRSSGDMAETASALFSAGRLLSRLGRRDSARLYHARSAQIRQKLRDTLRLAESLHALALASKSLQDHDSALASFSQALALRRAIRDDEGAAATLYELGNIHGEGGRHERAMTLYDEALRLYERVGSDRGRSLVLNAMAVLHKSQKRPMQALDLYQRSLELFIRSGDEVGQAGTLRNMGILHFEQGRVDEALELYERSRVLFARLGMRQQLNSTQLSIAGVNLRQGRSDVALAMYMDCLRISEELDSKPEMVLALLNIGVIHRTRANLDSSLGFFERARDVARHVGDLQLMRNVHLEISRLHAARQQYAEAYAAHLSYASLQDSLMNERNIKAATEMAARYESERKEQEITLLQKDATLRQIELQRRQQELTMQRLEGDRLLARAELYARERDVNTLALQQKATELELQRQRRNQEAALHERDMQHRSAASRRERVAFAGGLVLLSVIAVLVVRRARARRTEALLRAEAAEYLARVADAEKLQAQAEADRRSREARLIEAERMASLGHMTAGIAHEIKNPLNFINNFSRMSVELVDDLRSDLAEGRDIDATIALLETNLTKIHEHGARVDGIVKGMMLHARGGSSEAKRVQINTLLSETADLAWHSARARITDFRGTIERAFAADLPEINVRPQELSRAFMNVIGNAIDAVQCRAATEGPDYIPTITLRTRHDAGVVSIDVIDNGPGVPIEHRQRIFEPFFSTKAPGEGTGLGLSISYDIVTKVHNGTLTVECAPSGGAMFRITLPQS
jgi:two-component system, NtrC family, sensor kinase